MGKKIKSVKIIGVQRRRAPSKHYVYVIEVTWGDNSVISIFRRYSQFYDFHIKLLEDFPIEAGNDPDYDRILPYLAGKKLFGRSHTKKVAESRIELLESYLQELIKLPAKISQSGHVVKFLEATNTDIEPPSLEERGKKSGGVFSKLKNVVSSNDDDDDDEKEMVVGGVMQLDKYQAITDYKKQERNELTFKAGDVLYVVEKGDNGWWFAEKGDQKGWVPGTYLEPLSGQVEKHSAPVPRPDEKYITVISYEAENDDEIGYDKGVMITVLEKDLSGWWKVEYQGKVGVTPGRNLKEFKGHKAASDITSNNRPDSPKMRSKLSHAVPMRRESIRKSLSDDKKKPKRPALPKPTRPARPAKPNTASNDNADDGIQKMKTNRALYKDVDNADLPSGVIVEVFEESEDKVWTYVSYRSTEAWIPTECLDPISTTSTKGIKPPKPALPTAKPSKPVTPAKPSPVKPIKPSTPSKPTPSIADRAKTFNQKPNSGNVQTAIADMMRRQTEANSKPLKPSKPAKTPSPTRPTNPVKPPKPPQPSAVQKPPKPALPGKPKAQPVRPSKPIKPTKPVKPPLPSTAETSSVKYRVTETHVAEDDSAITVKKGQTVELLEKSDTGWWFVQAGDSEGWVPDDILEPLSPSKPTRPVLPKAAPAKTLKSDEYYVTETHIAETESETSVKKGDIVTVLEQDNPDWWFISKGSSEGWIPSEFLSKTKA